MPTLTKFAFWLKRLGLLKNMIIERKMENQLFNRKRDSHLTFLNNELKKILKENPNAD